MYNKEGCIQAEMYERVRGGTSLLSKKSNTATETKSRTEHRTLDAFFDKATVTAVSTDRHSNSRSGVRNWFSRMRPVREAVRGNSGGRTASTSIGTWRCGRAWEQRIVTLDIHQKIFALHYPRQTELGQIVVRKGRPSQSLDLNDTGRKEQATYTCGAVYIRPTQSHGLVTLLSGKQHPVHQMKIYKGKKAIIKIGSTVEDDLLFVRQQIGLMVERSKEDRDKEVAKSKGRRKSRGKNPNSGSSSVSFSGQKTKPPTATRGVRSLSDFVPTTTPLAGTVIGKVGKAETFAYLPSTR